MRADYYPWWRMPQGGEVHPCVAFWMGYFILDDDDDDMPTTFRW